MRTERELNVAYLRHKWDRLTEERRDAIMSDFQLDNVMDGKEPDQYWAPLLMPGLTKAPAEMDPMSSEYSGDLSITAREIEQLTGESVNVMELVEKETGRGDLERQTELIDDVHRSFALDKSSMTYTHLLNPDDSFVDYGDKLATSSDSIEVAQAMSKIAEASGWAKTRVSGTDEFREFANDMVLFGESRVEIEGLELPEVEAVQSQQATTEPDTTEPDTTEPENTATEVPVESQSEQDSELVAQRRTVILTRLNEQYRVSGKKYFIKDSRYNAPTLLAFKDRDTSIATSLNNEQVARSIVDLAEAKGWQKIRVSGHKQFRQMAWKAATERGIEVTGYDPTEVEKAAMERYLNKVEKVEEREATAEQQQSLPDPERPAQAAAPTRSRAASQSAVIVDHGPAPYQFNDDEGMNYFIKTERNGREKVTWGVDLERAIDEGMARVGDAVTIQNLGRKAVTIDRPVKDEHGVVIDTERVQTHRNAWKVELSDPQVRAEREQEARLENAKEIGRAAVEQRVRGAENQQRVIRKIDERLEESRDRIPSIDQQSAAFRRQEERQELQL